MVLVILAIYYFPLPILPFQKPFYIIFIYNIIPFNNSVLNSMFHPKVRGLLFWFFLVFFGGGIMF